MLVFAGAAHARAGHVPHALELVERGIVAGFRSTAWLRAEPHFDALRRHPRFVALAGAVRARPRRLIAASRPRASA